VTERLLLAKYLLAQYLREQAHWRLDAVDGSPLRAANCVLALIDAAAYVRELPPDDPCIATLAAAGWFAGGSFRPGEATREFIRRWQFEDRSSGGPRDLLTALASRCASRDRMITGTAIAPSPRAAADGGAQARGPGGAARTQVPPQGDSRPPPTRPIPAAQGAAQSSAQGAVLSPVPSAARGMLRRKDRRRG
jgi:hypothetical protein